MQKITFNESIEQLKNKSNSQLNQLNNDKDNEPFNQDKYDAAGSVADWIVSKLNAPNSRDFYCKVAYKLPHPTIDRLIATAIEKGKNPGALFNYLARKEMQ